YRVRGTDAAMAEEYFVFHSGMPRLRFACCGWENAHGGYGILTKEDAEEYVVSMCSEESLYSSRSEWFLIPWFYVTVEFFLEEP
ncbi:MAG: DUF4952 domain-containing protein, partial [Candidatus Accumulibacter sp.]|nr:DUF4952 domain-containing protein [Accumulibacter sp.]